MPKYRVLELSFINERLIPAGEEIEFAGDPGDNLEPLDDEAKAARDHFVNIKEPERIRKLNEQYGQVGGQSGIADMGEFLKQLAKANAEAQAEASAANAAIISKQVSGGIAAAFAAIFPNGFNKPAVLPAAPETASAAADLAPAADAGLV